MRTVPKAPAEPYSREWPTWVSPFPRIQMHTGSGVPVRDRHISKPDRKMNLPSDRQTCSATTLCIWQEYCRTHQFRRSAIHWNRLPAPPLHKETRVLQPVFLYESMESS